jgi:uroporphyrinogen decarboxylase
VIGLDWRVPIERGWAIVGWDCGVQGNLDPALLLGPFERVEAATVRILEGVNGRPGHIFNLGHGVLPDTDPAALRRLADLVHERTAVEVTA